MAQDNCIYSIRPHATERAQYGWFANAFPARSAAGSVLEQRKP